jgi:ring-1,2-phenylacetyl-CoA epoxidase subunit PaaC
VTAHSHTEEEDATNAYQSLAETVGHDDPRWAFGSGVEDVQGEIDSPVPDGVDAGDLAQYCLMLGDDALICSHRISEWVSNAPELEEEVALANIGLDLLGQARLLYSRAGQADGSGRSEDDFAYFRDPAEFRNVRLAELPNGDFAFSIARLLVLSCWRLALLERLAGSADPVLAAIAAKGVKELTYHRLYAADWTVRLGDGTEESHRRMQRGVDEVGPYLSELFVPRFGVDPDPVRHVVTETLRQVAEAAGLTLPRTTPPGRLGRDGHHTEHLAPLLAVLQSVARAHPEGVW